MKNKTEILQTGLFHRTIHMVISDKFIKTPAEDDTPTLTPNTPEVRRYRGRFLEGNNPVGQFSDIASIVTTP
jgi:hypothetical protein